MLRHTVGIISINCDANIIAALRDEKMQQSQYGEAGLIMILFAAMGQVDNMKGHFCLSSYQCLIHP
ncbi:hypothetical protein B0T41_06775 [Chromobacterium violaceum]|nr:hypothetical protein B0T41_06775 [Chromobacterium violaceum]